FRPSHVSAAAQALERAFRFLILGAPGALGSRRRLELGDDGVDRRRRAGDRQRAGGAAERAVAAAGSCEIEIDDRGRLAPDVAPHIELGPMEQRVDAQMRARRVLGPVIAPEFRRLVADVPGALLGARAEDALLGPRPLLVAADAGDDAGEAMDADRRLEPVGL